VEGLKAVSFSMKRLCDVGVTLHDCEHRTPKPSSNGGFPYIAIPDLRAGRIDLTNVRLISEADYESWTRKTRPQAGDVIMTRRGRVGDTAVVPKGLRCAIGQNLVLLRSDGTCVDQQYLRWTLRGPLYEQQVNKYRNVGAVFDSLNCEHIPLFEIPIPPLDDQRRIAGVLGALDDKIQHNRTLVRRLEVLIASSATKLLHETETVAPLSSLASFVNGRAFTKDGNGRGRPVLRIKELNDGITQSTVWSDIAAKDENIAGTDDLLFAWSGSLGVYRWYGPEALINQHIFKVIPKGKFPLWLVEYWVKSQLDEFRSIAGEKATTMGHIQRRHLDEATVPVPSSRDETQARVLLDPSDSLRAALAAESHNLEALRDALLPKLVSGQIRVSGDYKPGDTVTAAA
jgi:type I restriction enzyme S subunit